jgi:hypothetical protein
VFRFPVLREGRHTALHRASNLCYSSATISSNDPLHPRNADFPLPSIKARVKAHSIRCLCILLRISWIPHLKLGAVTGSILSPHRTVSLFMRTCEPKGSIPSTNIRATDSNPEKFTFSKLISSNIHIHILEYLLKSSKRFHFLIFSNKIFYVKVSLFPEAVP